jgi:hypothetical protein
MLQINDALISSELIENKFCCDLNKCKGACCVKGDSGAPLNADEVKLLPKLIHKIKPYLRKEGIEAIEKLGTHVIDIEHEPVTPLINGQECAYVVFDNEIARCGIERAHEEGVINFKKPVSCHLYPVRIKKYEQFVAVNYDKWGICEPARVYGEKLDLTVFEFAKDSLVRRFGDDWYKDLKIASQKMQNENSEFNSDL